jgi:hypothetical protein
VWRAQGGGECVHTFDTHTDYVQAIAAAPVARRFASAGLGGQVLKEISFGLSSLGETSYQPGHL